MRFYFIDDLRKKLKLIKKNKLMRTNIKYNYNREHAKDYAEQYALSANANKYPLYKENDCVNFVCQSMVAGGMKMNGNKHDSVTAWFCYSNNPWALEKTSLTWRSSQYFRMYWGNMNGQGGNRARYFERMTVEQAIQRYNELYNLLMIGDVIQYGDINDVAYHTQIVHGKEKDLITGRNDILIAQHTANRKNVSLYEYLKLLNNKKSKYVYLYHF